jgi:hypothetical protein
MFTSNPIFSWILILKESLPRTFRLA